MLVGPYGKGKSHLLLVLTALTSLDLMKNTPKAKAVQTELCEKIKKVDSEVGEMAENILLEKTRLLPVLVDSNSTDISKSLLRALYEALARADMAELLPSTHFDTAVDTVEQWEQDYPEAYQNFISLLKKRKERVSDLIIALKRFDSTAYETFTELYPQIAAGGKFNPMGSQNVLKVYDSVLDSLCKSTEYSGIHIILDEFSKFLEANLDSSKMANFKVIQDLAEKASRSKEQQLHFTCITHKNIVEYSTSPNFKAVDGRFLEVLFISSAQENYELIAHALEKTAKFTVFYSKYKKDFRMLEEYSLPLFRDFPEKEYIELVIKGCFPLSPICTFCLIAISELVGQNERTLFTFLAQNEKYSLAPFLQKERKNLELLTTDYLFDYFEILFQKELSHSPIHIIWSKTRHALAQCDGELEKRILKAMAILKMIGEPRLKTTKAHLKVSLMMDDEVFDMAVSPLLKKHILSVRDSQEFVLLTANGVDIKKGVEEYVSTKVAKIDVCALLTEHFDCGIVIPREYNDHFSMFRYFKQVYLEAKVLFQYQSPAQFFQDYPYDGVVVQLISPEPLTEEELQGVLDLFYDDPQVVFCVTDVPFQLEHLLKNIIAVSYLKKKNSGDTHYLEELEVFEEDLLQQISHTLEDYFAPSSIHSCFINGQANLNVMKKSMLSQRISEICHQTYPDTPVLNNEMVNKNLLNSQNVKGRNLAIDWVLQHQDQNVIESMEGSGSEASIFRSIYQRTGLNEKSRTPDQGLNRVLEVIEDFIVSSDNTRQSFKTPYTTLTKAPYGMRKGVIPLLLAYQLRQYYDGVTLYFSGKEQALTSSTLSSINENPEGYELLVEENTLERKEYLSKLYHFFLPDSPVGTSVYPVVEAMKGWILSLPEYSKYYKKELDGSPLPPSYLRVRQELLKFDLNPRTLVYEIIPKSMGSDDNFPATAEKIGRLKEILDSHKSRCEVQLIQDTKALFSPNYEGSLTEAIKLWHRGVSGTITQRNSKELLRFAETLTSYNKKEVLSQLIQIFVGISLADWNDKSSEIYDTSLRQSLAHCREQSQIKTKEENKQVAQNKQAIKSKEKKPSTTKISPMGENIKNSLQSLLEEYQEAVEPEEMIAILTSLMEEL